MTLAIALALMAHGTHHAKPKPPKQPHTLGTPRTWFSAKDYPQDALVARKSGTTGFEVDIDANGLPTDCRVTQSAGFKSLDDRTCTIMMSRSRFRPAIAAGGKAVPTVFRHSMKWTLPGKREEKVVDRSFDAKSMIAPTGEVLSCTMSGAGASKIGAAGGSCGPFGNRDFFAFLLKDDYKRTRATNVRLVVSFNGAPPPAFDRPPSVRKELAKAALDIAPTGEMTSCTSIIKMEALGRTMDLCDFVRADPPRFPAAATARKSTLALELAAFFN